MAGPGWGGMDDMEWEGDGQLGYWWCNDGVVGSIDINRERCQARRQSEAEDHTLLHEPPLTVSTYVAL